MIMGLLWLAGITGYAAVGITVGYLARRNRTFDSEGTILAVILWPYVIVLWVFLVFVALLEALNGTLNAWFDRH